MIDTSMRVRFYDDRGKDKGYYIIVNILFEDLNVCLCTVTPLGVSKTLFDKWEDIPSPYVLFDKSDGHIMTENLQFWIAENYNRMSDEPCSRTAQ